MCDTQRLSSPGNNNNTALSTTTSPSSQRQTLVRTSSCQHNSGCFCHAHLGWLTDSRSLRFLFCVSEISETVSRLAPIDKKPAITQLIEVAISTVMCAESKLGILSLLFLPKRTQHGMLVVITSASTLKLIDVVKVVTYFLCIQSDLFCSCCSELLSFACTKGSNSQPKQKGSDQTGSSFPPMKVVYDIQTVCVIFYYHPTTVYVCHCMLCFIIISTLLF